MQQNTSNRIESNPVGKVEEKFDPLQTRAFQFTRSAESTHGTTNSGEEEEAGLRSELSDERARAKGLELSASMARISPP